MMIAMFLMFCIIFVYRTIQKWRPMIDQAVPILTQSYVRA